MIRRALRSQPLILVATALLSVGCGGAINEGAPASSASAASSARSSAASGQGSAKGDVIEIIPGSPRLKVAGGEIEGGLMIGSLNQPFVLGNKRAAVARTEMESEGFRVADLPLTAVPDPLSASDAPSFSPPGDDATEIFVDWPGAPRSNSMITKSESSPYTSVRVTLRGPALGRIRIGGSEGTVMNNSGGGVYVVCHVPDESPRRFVPARWESLAAPAASASGAAAAGKDASAKPALKGPVTLTITDAWFDLRECKATVVRRTAIQVKPLAGGLLFAYREACTKCGSNDAAARASGSSSKPETAPYEVVTLLGPMPSSISTSGIGGDATQALGAVARVSLPIRRGGGGTLLARYSSNIAHEWLGSFGRTENLDSDLVAGVDITQGVGDPEPVAIAYASRADGAAPSTEVLEDAMPMQAAPKSKAVKQSSRGELVDPFGRRDRLGF